MIVAYKLTRHDRREALRLALPCFSLAWRIVFTSMFLLFFGGLLTIFWSAGYSGTWPLRGPFPWHVLKDVSIFAGIILVTLLANISVILLLTASQSVEITPLHLSLRTKITTNPTRWKDVTHIFNTEEYVCFCMNMPTAVVIPKRAFPCS